MTSQAACSLWDAKLGQVGVDLSRDGKSLVSGTIATQITTTEPDGHGSGQCTNATATEMISAI